MLTYVRMSGFRGVLSNLGERRDPVGDFSGNLLWMLGVKSASVGAGEVGVVGAVWLPMAFLSEVSVSADVLELDWLMSEPLESRWDEDAVGSSSGTVGLSGRAGVGGPKECAGLECVLRGSILRGIGLDGGMRADLRPFLMKELLLMASLGESGT